MEIPDKLIEKFVDKISRKAALTAIGIIAILLLKIPDPVTWSNASLFVLLVGAIVWLVTYCTHYQYVLDLSEPEKNEELDPIDEPHDP